MAGSWGDRINVAIQAVAQVLLVCGMGAWLAKRKGLNRAAINAVSLVNWFALIPSLMFSSIVGAVTPGTLSSLWPLLVASLLHILIGVVPATLLAWAARLPKDMAFFTASSLPNCGNLPWLFMPGLIRYYAAPEAANEQVQRMVGLVSVYTIVVVLVTLVVPFLFKRPPDTLLLPRSRSEEQQRHEQQQEQQQERQEQHHEERDEQQRWRQRDQEERGSEDGSEGGDTQPRRHHKEQPHAVACVLASAHRVAPDDNGAPPAGLPDAHSAALTAAPEAGRRGGPAFWGPDAAADSGPPGLVAIASVSSLADDCHVFELDAAEDGAALPPAAAHRDYAHHPLQHQQFDSFASHRSGSHLLQQGRQLWGSFSRSLGRSFSRGLRRSNSRVQLVWTFPSGWQPARSGGAAAAAAPPPARQPDGRAVAAAPAAAVPPPRGLRESWRRARAAAGPPPRWVQAAVLGWRAVYAHPVVNLPLGATIVGLACAAVGPVRKLLVDDLAPLHWLWSSLVWVGAASAPLATMQIGAELLQGPPVVASSRMRVSRRSKVVATAISIVVKLILVPLINVAIMRNGGFGRLAPAGDPLYQLLLLVEGAVPAAVTLLVVCGRVYPDSSPLSTILFCQYVASLFTLPAFIVWFLSMLDL